MPQDDRKAAAPRAGKPGGDRFGGGDRRDGGKGRPGGKGKFGKGGPSKPVRTETYESLKEVVRGADFRIDKFMLADKISHKAVKVEYRLTREGLPAAQSYERLAEAQAAAIAPLPEPVPETAPETETSLESQAEGAMEVSDIPSEETGAEPAGETGA